LGMMVYIYTYSGMIFYYFLFSTIWFVLQG
jgi:hypothetical protein